MKLCLVKFNKNRVGQTRRIYHHLGLITMTIKYASEASCCYHQHFYRNPHDYNYLSNPAYSTCGQEKVSFIFTINFLIILRSRQDIIRQNALLLQQYTFVLTGFPTGAGHIRTKTWGQKESHQGHMGLQ